MSAEKKPPDNFTDNPAILEGLKYSHLIDLLPGYLSIQDRNFRILYVNQNFKDDLGDATGKYCYRVNKGSREVCPNCPVQKTFRDKQTHLSEETFRLLNGKICQVLIQTSPILDDDNQVAAVIEMATNITRLKNEKKELATLGQSIALLSHGIKNILEGLQGGAYVVDEAFKDENLELARRGWNIVNKNIFEITDIVKNILYSSKNRPLKYEQVSPGILVADSLSLFHDKAAGLQIRLKSQINPELPDVYIDVASIRRMLNNLIWNAIEACLKDSSQKNHFVSVRTDFYDADHFLFEIIDNGIGMDQATQRNIFEEFFSTKGSDGTGLGLAVAEKIINKHGGTIEVDSAPGKGTKFTIMLKIK